MTYQRPIFWQEGTFLEPQHFQLLEMQRRGDLSFLAGRLNPYAWGVTKLEINEDPLLNFVFELISLDLWLPDGRRLLFPENLMAPSRSFRKAWLNPDEPLLAALAVPHFSHRGPNVNKAEGGEKTSEAALSRNLYNAAAEPEMIPDILGDGPDGRIETLYYNAHLLFGEETQAPNEGMDIIPLAHVIREGEKVSLLSGYVPPSLTLYPGNPLYEIMTDVLEIMRAKNRQLEEYKVSPNQNSQDSQAGGSHAFLVFLSILCRYIPRFHLLLAAPVLSPWTAFMALRELAGELTIFAPGLSPLGESERGSGEPLLPYDHLDPFPAFAETKAMITRLLDAVSIGPEMNLIFQKEGHLFSLEMPAWLDANFICWLAVRSELPKEEMGRSVANYGKLAPPNKIETLIAYTLPGITLTPLATAPAGLPRREDTVYFNLRLSDPMWEEALKTRRLSFFWDSAPETGFVSLISNRAG
jgi:type VI secretion system protein ImpJ